MALQKTITFRGLNAENAYHAIKSVKAIKNDDTGLFNIEAEVITYVDNTKENSLEGDLYHFSGITEENLTIPAVYAALKTLPKFKESTDV